MPKVKTVPKLCLDLDSTRGELVWFGLESIFAHANPQHPFSKLLGAQCSSTTNGRAVAIFINFFTILRFFPFSKLLGEQCSSSTKARQVATSATTPVSKRLGAQCSSSTNRYRVQQHSLQCASGRSASLLHIKCARFSFAPCFFLLPHAQHGERDFSITNMHLHS